MRILTILTLLLSSLHLNAQFSMESFLASAVEDAELMEVLNSLEYLENHRFNSPWIREIDVRLRSNDFQADLEDYRMRFGITNPFMVMANNSHRKVLETTLEAEKVVKRSEILRNRYHLLIENADLHVYLELTKKKLEALKRLEDVQRLDELEDWIEIQSDITKEQLLKKELEEKLRINEFLIRERMSIDQPIEIDTATLITEGQLFELISVLVNDDEEGLLKQLNMQKALLRESELSVERAENRKSIGYLQAEYDPQRGDNFNSHAGFQVGISLPIINPDKANYQREVLKQLESESEGQLEEIERSRAMGIATMDIEYKRSNLLYLKDRLVSIQPLSTELSNPKLYIRYLDYKHFLLEKYLTEKSELMYILIELLHEKGKLVEAPAINYLSRNFRTY